MKQTLKIGAMLLVVAALATTGVALAQSGDSATTDQSVPATERPVYSKILEWLAPLVDEGTIDQSQAEAVAGTLAESLPAMPHHMGRALDAMREAADFLGLTPQEIAEGLRDGATLAEIAADNGSSGEALINHLVGVTGDRLDEAVAAGRITAEEKAQILANAIERITDLVNGDIERPFLGGPGGHMGPGPGRGMGGGPCQDGTVDSGDLGA